MNRIPRHLFVPNALQHQAYGDHPLPIGGNQTIQWIKRKTMGTDFKGASS